jgi:hypothetical protein
MIVTIVNIHSVWCTAEKTHPEEKEKRRKTHIYVHADSSDSYCSQSGNSHLVHERWRRHRDRQEPDSDIPARRLRPTLVVLRPPSEKWDRNCISLSALLSFIVSRVFHLHEPGYITDRDMVMECISSGGFHLSDYEFGKFVRSHTFSGYVLHHHNSVDIKILKRKFGLLANC